MCVCMANSTDIFTLASPCQLQHSFQFPLASVQALEQLPKEVLGNHQVLSHRVEVSRPSDILGPGMFEQSNHEPFQDVKSS